MRHRDSTKVNYYGIWKNFNQFFIKLDCKPNTWEDRIVLYAAYLIQNHKKSTTVKSYVSAIKAVLFNGGIEITEDSTLLTSLTRACHLNKDRISPHLMICKGLVGRVVQQIKFKFQSQPYLATLYKALIITTYFGTFRIGELTQSNHVVKAWDVHVGVNKPM